MMFLSKNFFLGFFSFHFLLTLTTLCLAMSLEKREGNMHEPVEEYSTMTQQFLINALARILNIDENLFHHIIKVCNNEIDVLCPQALLALHNMGIRGSYPIVLENKSVLFFDETTGHINEFIKSYILQNLELIQKHSPQMLTLMSSPLLGNVPY